MNLLNNPVYITATELIDSTLNIELKALDTATIEQYITEAQMIIDSYIWCYWTPYEDTQQYIFPINNDWVAYIPNDIKIACVYIVEDIFVTWPATSSSEWRIKSETTGDHSWSYDYAGVENKSSSLAFIPDKAMKILSRYKRLFYKQVI